MSPERETSESTASNVVSLEQANPETLREEEDNLNLTDSVAALLPESLIRRYGPNVNDEYPEGRVWEFWPEFECRACRKGKASVVYEYEPGVSDEIDKDKLGIQFAWEGMRPVCQRCGSGLADRTIERYRPARWKQPLLHAMMSVGGLSMQHDPLFEKYDHAPVEFITASEKELQEVDGIGEVFAENLVIKKYSHFPKVALEPTDE